MLPDRETSIFTDLLVTVGGWRGGLAAPSPASPAGFGLTRTRQCDSDFVPRATSVLHHYSGAITLAPLLRRI